VQVPYIKETLALFGTSDASVSEAVKIPKNIYPTMGDITAQAASTAMVGLREAVQYVFEYPYGCLEQKSSRVLPYILADDLIESFKLKTAADTVKGGKKAVVNGTLDEFEKYQLPNGGFTYWTNFGYVEAYDYLSVYATYTLLKADDAGYKASGNVLTNALGYVRTLLFKNDASYFGKRSLMVTKAFALYTLALAGEFNSSAAEKLYQDRAELPVEAKAYLLRAYALQGKSSAPIAMRGKGKFSAGGNSAARIQTLSRELLNMAKVEPSLAHFEDGSEEDYIWTFGSNVKTSAATLTALVEAGEDKGFADKVVAWLLSVQKNGRWSNTQENIFVLEALNTYFRKYESEPPNFSVKFTLAAQTILDESFKGRTLEAKVKTTELSKFTRGDEMPLQIEKSGTGRVYYGLRLSYFPTYALNARDNGISLYRKVEPLVKGDSKGSAFQAGNIVKVTIQIAVPQEMNFVAINDPLAAGLEAINPTLKTSGSIPSSSGAPQAMSAEGEGEGESGDYENAYKPNGNATFDHIELRDDRVTLFAARLARGVHTYTYYARATTYGTFLLPPSTAEKMYQPEVFGRTGTTKLSVENLK
jgi:alpha-2-macroglobulin